MTTGVRVKIRGLREEKGEKNVQRGSGDGTALIVKSCSKFIGGPCPF